MKRENSWVMFLFRFLLGAAFIAALFMLYWSSLLQEERLRSIESCLQEIKSQLSTQDVRTRNGEIDKTTHAVVSALVSQKKRLQIDENLPNLLKDDPYFTTTLPKILPPHFSPKGVLRAGSPGNAHDLHPFTAWAHTSEWLGLCLNGVADLPFGKYEPLAPGFAIKIEERPSGKEDRATFWVHLRDGLFWQPLNRAHFPEGFELSSHFLKAHPVTAYDFQFYFQAFKNPHVDVAAAVTLRTLFADMDKVEVIDDQTFVVHYVKNLVKDADGKETYRLPYKASLQVAALRPLACFVYKYTPDGKKITTQDSDPDFYQKSSLWAQYFARHFAIRVIPSCGRWVFDGATEREIRFRRNNNYYSPYYALFEGLDVFLVDSPDAIWRDFMAQKVDYCFLSPQNVVELNRFMKSPFYLDEKKKGNEVKRLEYVDGSYSYIGWNFKKPLFSNKKVRQALTMAIDRKRLIQQSLNGLGIEVTGPFASNSTSYDLNIKPWPYDPDEAKRLLAQDGWIDRDGSGVISKVIDGKNMPFQFQLTYYVKNPVTRSNVELIASQLKQVGILCEPYGVDVQDLTQVLDDKSFDAYALAWTAGTPPEDPRQIWHSSTAQEKGSSNTISFANKEADELIELLTYESDPTLRTKYYHQFHALMHEEAPYTFLYTPKLNMVLWNWIENVFVPAERQDLIPGAVTTEPQPTYGWKRMNYEG